MDILQMFFNLDLLFSETEKIKLLKDAHFLIKTEAIKERVPHFRGPKPKVPDYTYYKYKVVYEGSKFLGKLDDVFKEKASKVVKKLIEDNF